MELTYPLDTIALLPESGDFVGRVVLYIGALDMTGRTSETQSQEHLVRIQSGTTWVAEDRGSRIVGFLSAERFDDALHVWELAVRSENQRQGIGTRLLEAAAEWSQVGSCKCSTFAANSRIWRPEK